MRIKVEWTDDGENRISERADAGKPKLMEDGKVDIDQYTAEQRHH